jgi:hypothetical protein
MVSNACSLPCRFRARTSTESRRRFRKGGENPPPCLYWSVYTPWAKRRAAQPGRGQAAGCPSAASSEGALPGEQRRASMRSIDARQGAFLLVTRGRVAASCDTAPAAIFCKTRRRERDVAQLHKRAYKVDCGKIAVVLSKFIGRCGPKSRHPALQSLTAEDCGRRSAPCLTRHSKFFYGVATRSRMKRQRALVV